MRGWKSWAWLVCFGPIAYYIDGQTLGPAFWFGIAAYLFGYADAWFIEGDEKEQDEHD